MKILMLAPGKSIHSKRSLNWLLESGCHVTFMDYTNPRPRGGSQAYQFIPYLGMRGIRVYRHIVGPQAANAMGLWVGTSWLRLAARHIKPAIVHVQWVDHRAYCCLKAGLKPLVLTAWGTDINKHFLPGADQQARQMIGQALAGADLVIGHAQEIADKCVLLAGSELRTDILTYGVDTKLFHPGHRQGAMELRRRLDIPSDATILLSPRALMPNYGHHLVLEAFAQARPHLDTDLILVFRTIAAIQAYETEIRRRAEELGVSKSVRWLGQVAFEQMPEVYAFADLVVNYPAMDAFPITFLEAAASERPVITCRLPSYQGTFAEHYFCMVEPQSVTDLTRAIIATVRQDSAARARLLAKARRVIEREYDESVSAKRLLNLYQSVLTGGANGDPYQETDRREVKTRETHGDHLQS